MTTHAKAVVVKSILFAKEHPPVMRQVHSFGRCA
jgi:hypothetical protein